LFSKIKLSKLKVVEMHACEAQVIRLGLVYYYSIQQQQYVRLIYCYSKLSKMTRNGGPNEKN